MNNFSQPVTLIHVRSLYPLSVSFPSPGTYTGLVKIILPMPSVSILAQLQAQAGTNLEPPCLEFSTGKGQISAAQILGFIKANKAKIKQAIGQVAAPYGQEKLKQALMLARPATPRKQKLIRLSNPYRQTKSSQEATEAP